MCFHEAEHCRGQLPRNGSWAVGLPLAVEGIFLHYTKPLGNANKNPQWTHQLSSDAGFRILSYNSEFYRFLKSG
jgi:hypothetical protein